MSEKRGAVRILIADDHPIFRCGLRMLLESEPRFKVIGQAVDGYEIIKLASSLKPDVLLLDLAMPRLTGLEVLRDMAVSERQIRTIVLTAAIEKAQIVEALQLGARGILLKDAAIELVTKCIDKVIAGEYWVGRETVIDLVAYLRSLERGPGAEVPQRMLVFTPREREIISAIVTGSVNKDIAAKLFLSEDTVKHHLSHIFAKAGVSNRLELAVWSMNQGLV
jgi:two-component system, NarL family, nitrate/nitrite response regulator NarL